MGKKRNKRRAKAYSDKEDESDENISSNKDKTVSGPLNSDIEKLKQSKSRNKAGFTRARHCLLQLLDGDLPSRRQLREARENLGTLSEKVMENMSLLSDKYSEKNDVENVKKISKEMEQIEQEFADAQNRTQEYLDARKDDPSSIASDMSRKVRELQLQEREAREFAELLEAGAIHEEEEIALAKRKMEQEYEQRMNELESRSQAGKEQLLNAKAEMKKKQNAVERGTDEELGLGYYGSPTMPKRDKIQDIDDNSPAPPSPSTEIGHDLWKQLKRVSIPVFSGEKSTYENWKAAFLACIDKAPATPEYKLLQLRQYLSGEAIKVIENLGHSAAAYEAAKSRLERKYGGTRRQIALYIEELESFRPIRMGDAKDLERFADLLDIAVINLKGQTEKKS